MKRWWRRILLPLATLGVACGICLWYFSPQVTAVRLARQLGREHPYVRMVPLALPDTSVSTAPGTRLTHCGYDFEVPWNDLDEAETTLALTGSCSTSAPATL